MVVYPVIFLNPTHRGFPRWEALSGFDAMVAYMDSSVFCTSRHLDITRVESLLRLAAQRYIEMAGEIKSAALVLSKAKSELDSGNMPGVFSVLRSNASILTPEPHNHYWNWIDAYGFFVDAVLDRWTHMSMERRSQCLKWAEEHALSICNSSKL